MREKIIMRQPFVSVVVPVYNVEQYLEECLDSLLNQTLENIEMICVNDGSTDHSLHILEKYAARDDRIKVITQANRGLSGARNTGAKLARGEYIYFIDSDDYIDPDALEYLYHEAHTNNLDILYFDGMSFYESEEIKKLFPGVDYCYREKEYAAIYRGEDLYVAMSEDGQFRPMVWLQFISTDFYRKNQLSFYEGILHEDEDFSHITVFKAQRVSHRRKQFYHYRRRKGAITFNQSTFKHVYGKLFCLIDIFEYVRSHTISNEAILCIGKYLNWLYGYMKESYLALPVEEKAKVTTLTPEQHDKFNLYLSGNLDFIQLLQIEKLADTPRIQSEKAELEVRIREQEKELQFLRQQLHDVKSGYSFRTGRIITFIPRKIRGGYRCFREHGAAYTIRRTLWHLGIIRDWKE